MKFSEKYSPRRLFGSQSIFKSLTKHSPDCTATLVINLRSLKLTTVGENLVKQTKTHEGSSAGIRLYWNVMNFIPSYTPEIPCTSENLHINYNVTYELRINEAAFENLTSKTISFELYSYSDRREFFLGRGEADVGNIAEKPNYVFDVEVEISNLDDAVLAENLQMLKVYGYLSISYVLKWDVEKSGVLDNNNWGNLNQGSALFRLVSNLKKGYSDEVEAEEKFVDSIDLGGEFSCCEEKRNINVEVNSKNNEIDNEEEDENICSKFQENSENDKDKINGEGDEFGAVNEGEITKIENNKANECAREGNVVGDGKAEIFEKDCSCGGNKLSKEELTKKEKICKDKCNNKLIKQKLSDKIIKENKNKFAKNVRNVEQTTKEKIQKQSKNVKVSKLKSKSGGKVGKRIEEEKDEYVLYKDKSVQNFSDCEKNFQSNSSVEIVNESKTKRNSKVKSTEDFLLDMPDMRRTLEEYAIISGENPSVIESIDWRNKNLYKILLRSYENEGAIYKPEVVIYIYSMKLYPDSSPMRNETARRFYVEYKFLSHEGPQMESKSLVKSVENSSLKFNFRREFPLDFKENYEDCKLLARMVRSRKCLIIDVVNEGIEMRQEIQSCEAIGYCEIRLFDLIQLEENFLKAKFSVVSYAKPSEEIGYLRISISGIQIMRKVVLDILKDDRFEDGLNEDNALIILP